MVFEVRQYHSNTTMFRSKPKYTLKELTKCAHVLVQGTIKTEGSSSSIGLKITAEGQLGNENKLLGDVKDNVIKIKIEYEQFHKFTLKLAVAKSGKAKPPEEGGGTMFLIAQWKENGRDNVFDSSAEGKWEGGCFR